MEKFLYSVFALLALAACSSNDEPDFNDEGSKIEIPAGERVVILNQGSWNMNNASISLFSPKTSGVISDLYFTQNGRRLGDNAQDIIEHDGSIYVAVNGSNYLTRLNEAGVEQARVSFAEDTDLQGGVRCLAAKGKYVYATFYGGYIARINASSLAIEAKLKTSGGNLEGILIENGKIYVANSWSVSYDAASGQTSYTYHDNLIVVDLNTFKETGSLKVESNPNLLAVEDDLIFLISWGNYADKGNMFQVVDPATGKSTPVTEAKDMAVGDDTVYLLKTMTDWTTGVTENTWMSYDIKSRKLNTSSFLVNAPEALASGSIYMLEVDPDNGDIYIGITFYNSGNGDIYRFDRNGRLIEQFDAGGQNPFKAVFID